jgi:hypothetical protein
MKTRTAQSEVKSSLSAQVAVDSLDGLVAGYPLQKLKDQSAQQHHRFKPPVGRCRGCRAGLKLFSASGQHQPNLLRKELLLVLLAEQRRRDRVEALE